MKTAAYTICKNEIKFVEKWLYYTKDFTYRVLLDTGSTDGTYEALLEAQKNDSNLIVEQKIFTPWKFNIARNYNLDMIPQDVDWCLSPDLDEYFSINVLNQMKNTIENNPNVTNIACDRLDVYSSVVRVGPPHCAPTNKIHKRFDYHWVQPIYEHLWFKYHDIRKECEIYNKDIYLIHDQDFKKQSRTELYTKMLTEEFEENPTNCWTLWFLLNHYFRVQDLDNFIEKSIVFLKYSEKNYKFNEIKKSLEHIFLNVEITENQKENIKKVL
jgi:glycosyltransferase involved in cell wall biosynthesis